MPETLTNRQILAIHQLSRDGLAPSEVARRLNIHRNSVRTHLNGQVRYSPDLIHALGVSSPLLEKEYLTLEQAAAWLPFHPSSRSMHKLAASGELKTMKLISEYCSVHTKIMTNFDFLTEYALENYPTGLFVSHKSLAAILEVESVPQDLGIKLPAVKRVRPKIMPLASVRTVLADMNDQLQFSAVVIKRCLMQSEKIGVAVI